MRKLAMGDRLGAKGFGRLINVQSRLLNLMLLKRLYKIICAYM